MNNDNFLILRLYALRKRFLRKPAKVSIATAVPDIPTTTGPYRRFRFSSPVALTAGTHYLFVLEPA